MSIQSPHNDAQGSGQKHSHNFKRAKNLSGSPVSAISARITVNDRSADAEFASHVNSEIERWASNAGLDLSAGDSENDSAARDFQVAFFDEDHVGKVSCLIVVKECERLWRAWESASDLRQALTMSLSTLAETSKPSH